jgi:hypothetical protein
MNNETGRNHSSSLSRLAADGACPNGLTSAPEKMLKIHSLWIQVFSGFRQAPNKNIHYFTRPNAKISGAIFCVS